MRAFFAVTALAFGCVACSTTASPVTQDYRTTFGISRIHVDLPDDEKIPDRYDESINDLLEEEGLPADFIGNFTTYADTRGGLDQTNSGELFLEYLVLNELESRLPRLFSGDRDAEFELKIASTVFPNAATMMLVGEVIGTSYEFSLTDSANGTVLVESTEPISPPVQRSAGANGGLLGLALRGGGDRRHLNDLDNIATAIASEVANILGGYEIYSSDVNRIGLQPIPDAN